MCGSNPFPSPSRQEADKVRRDIKNGDYSDNWSRCKNETAQAYRAFSWKELLRIEAQAGKTYYVRWSAPYAPFRLAKSNGSRVTKMELVDEATGASEISGLRAATDSHAKTPKP
jgi:hypothetical protein